LIITKKKRKRKIERYIFFLHHNRRKLYKIQNEIIHNVQYCTSLIVVDCLYVLNDNLNKNDKII